jgi:ribosomal protein S18 acetylase RimI-like enzyme
MTDVLTDNWLTDMMGTPVYRVDLSAEVSSESLASRVAAHIQERDRAFYWAKVDTQRTDLVRSLGAVGFYVVDTNVSFELAREPVSVESEVVVEEFRSDHEAAVLAIAASAFRRDRFHLDPLIPNDVADRIKREWCRNYAVKARGDRLFVAEMEGQPAGFLAALTGGPDSGRVAVIDLIGVAPAFQRRKVGLALSRAFIRHYRPVAASLQVGTQVSNIASIRLYERLGFTALRSQYVLHLHVDKRRARS